MASKGKKITRVKVGTMLDPEIYRRLKQRALSEHKPVHRVMEAAIERYTDLPDAQAAERRQASMTAIFKERFKNVSKKDLKKILEMDPYDDGSE